MCLCVSVYVCMGVCVCDVYMPVCLCVCDLYVCLCVYDVYVCLCMCLCMCVCMYLKSKEWEAQNGFLFSELNSAQN